MTLGNHFRSSLDKCPPTRHAIHENICTTSCEKHQTNQFKLQSLFEVFFIFRELLIILQDVLYVHGSNPSGIRLNIMCGLSKRNAPLKKQKQDYNSL